MEEPEILIVDDNPEIREVAMVLLQGEGFTVMKQETERKLWIK
mgnify:CR=1 FL=1